MFSAMNRMQAPDLSTLKERLDLLVYTPAEFAEMRAEGRPFIEDLLRDGVVVHEAGAEG